MKTIQKSNKLNGAIVEKKLTPKQKKFIELVKETQKTLTKLYNEGKIDIYDPIR